MNAVASLKVVDWSQRSAQLWLEQYGLWVRSGKGKAVGVSANPLAVLIDKNDEKRISKSKLSRPCEISDFEAVEISKLLSKMHSDKREYLAERAWLLILKHENNWKDQVIANVHGVSRAYVRAEIDKGHSYLNGVMDAMGY